MSDQWILIASYSMYGGFEDKETSVHKTAYNGFEIVRYSTKDFNNQTGKYKNETTYSNKYLNIETDSLKEIKEKIDSMYEGDSRDE